MRKRLRARRRVWERWIWPAAFLLVAAGLVTAGLVSAYFWLRGNQPVWLQTVTGEGRLIVTATATLNPVPEKDGAPLTLQPEENWPLPDRFSEPPPHNEAMPFTLQFGSPKYLPAFAHADKGCAWIGFGGQVFDETGASLDGLVVFLSGTLDDQPLNLHGITAPQNVFGPGGYEIFLTDRLPQQALSVNLQLFDVRGQALSEAVKVALPTSCEQNLVLVNFQSGISDSTTYLPLVNKEP